MNNEDLMLCLNSLPADKREAALERAHEALEDDRLAVRTVRSATPLYPAPPRDRKNAGQGSTPKTWRK